jgi:hypothetical protein
MTLRRNEFNKLLVEGKQDLFVIAELLDHYIVWGGRHDECVEGICDYDGVDDLLGPDEIETVLLTPNLAALGIVVDANGDANLRWHQVRSHCTAQFPALPANLPPDGLIVMNERGLRLGVWIMPDNQSQGMIESLLRCCVPQAAQPVLDHALQSLTNARAIGAPVKEAHLDKAHVHTWLAWQDPPGLQLHQAVIAHVLDAASPLALPFVEWFIRLFQLDDLRRPPTP